jgi:hypothetical protein
MRLLWQAIQERLGFIKKDDDAYSVYFATLHIGHSDIMVGLTVSIGKWWDDNAVDERHWIFLTVTRLQQRTSIRELTSRGHPATKTSNRWDLLWVETRRCRAL